MQSPSFWLRKKRRGSFAKSVHAAAACTDLARIFKSGRRRFLTPFFRERGVGRVPLFLFSGYGGIFPFFAQPSPCYFDTKGCGGNKIRKSIKNIWNLYGGSLSRKILRAFTCILRTVWEIVGCRVPPNKIKKEKGKSCENMSPSRFRPHYPFFSSNLGFAQNKKNIRQTVVCVRSNFSGESGGGRSGVAGSAFCHRYEKGGKVYFWKEKPFFSQFEEEEEANYSWELKEEIRHSAFRTLKKYPSEKAHEFRNNFRSDLEA